MTLKETAMKLPIESDSTEEIKDNLISIFFTKSTSSYYLYAIGIAKGAFKYQEIGSGKELIHAAIFNHSKEQASRAISLLELVEKWQGSQVKVCSGDR